MTFKIVIYTGKSGRTLGQEAETHVVEVEGMNAAMTLGVELAAGRNYTVERVS